MIGIAPLRHRLAMLLALPCLWLAGCGSRTGPTVTVYTSQDQVFAEAILDAFTRETGINTRVLYDSEAVKTVGLANRLLAERDHPQCDLFWNNEELRTLQLASHDLFEPTNGWARFGFRTRRIVINTNLLALSLAPASLKDLTNSQWRGKLAMAFPLFGTTATHFLALRDAWGEPAWLNWCRALRANDPLIVDGNSVVVQLVGRGEAAIGLTDSDDIAAGQRREFPIVALPLTRDSTAIPNTVALVRGAPHPQNARRLFDYLQTPAVSEELRRVNALEPGAEPALELTNPDWSSLLVQLDRAAGQLKQIFLR
jgi:iron(III) transport system substrate-binding protein